MFKNTSNQKVGIFAWDGANGTAKTGDAANIYGYISKDGATVIPTNDANPTELDSSYAKGIYIFDMLKAETNADLVVISPHSCTVDVIFKPSIIYPNEVNAIHAETSALVGPISSISTRIESLQADTTAMKPILSSIHTETSALTGVVASIHSETTIIRTETSAIKLAISTLSNTALMDSTYEGDYKLRDYLRLSGAALFGPSTGGGTTRIKFQDITSVTDRISAQITTAGNRTSVILNAS